jgi:hypothetical protein
VLPQGQGFEPHYPHLFAKYLIFHFFFFQSIQTSTTKTFAKPFSLKTLNRLFQNQFFQQIQKKKKNKETKKMLNAK